MRAQQTFAKRMGLLCDPRVPAGNGVGVGGGILSAGLWASPQEGSHHTDWLEDSWPEVSSYPPSLLLSGSRTKCSLAMAL